MPERRKGIVDRIKHFTPSWFAVNMGIGIIGILIDNLPYGNQQARDIVAFIILIVNTILFVGFTVMSAARYVMFPQIWSLMLKEPVQSLFLGCFPMALSTIISASASLSRNRIASPAWFEFLWYLWWVDSAMAVASCILLPYIMITRHNHTLDMQTAAWLLPVVPPIVSASCGAVITSSLIDLSLEKAKVTVAISALLVTTGLSISMMLSATYLLRLIAYGFPKAGLVVSVFLPLGPCGQGGFALLLLSQHAYTFMSETGVDGAFYGKSAIAIGTTGSLILWAIGLWFAILAAMGLLEATFRSTVPFKVNFWGMIFPWGVYSLLTLQLGKTLNLDIFRVLGTIFTSFTTLLWAAITTKTLYLAWGGSIFHAPCLDDAPPIARWPNHSAQDSDTLRMEGPFEGNGNAQ